MVDMTAITAVAASLNAAKEITKAMIGLRDAALIQGKVIELNSTILDAQSSAFAANDERSALIEQVRDLEKEIGVTLLHRRKREVALTPEGSTVPRITPPLTF